MELKLTEEDIKNLISKEALVNAIADKILEGNTDKQHQVLENELKKEFEKAQKKIIKEHMEEYSIADHKAMIKEILISMSKAEVVYLLSGRVDDLDSECPF